MAAGVCPKNLAFARKIMALPESGGEGVAAPLARTPMNHLLVIEFNSYRIHTKMTRKRSTAITALSVGDDILTGLLVVM